MSKINVEIDTKEKTLNVVMDGKKFDNVSSVDFFRGFENNEFNASVTTVERIDDEDLTKVTRISAKDGIVETTKSSNLRKILANKLFPRKVV